MVASEIRVWYLSVRISQVLSLGLQIWEKLFPFPATSELDSLTGDVGNVSGPQGQGELSLSMFCFWT